MTAAARLVIVDPVALVEAEVYSSPTWDTWPLVPPATTNPSADCLGVAFHHPSWALAVSPEILGLTATVLIDEWELDEHYVTDYMAALADLAKSSGGGLYAPVGEPPPGPGVGADLRAVAHLISWVQAEAAVLQPPRAPLGRGQWEGCWVTDPRAFAEHAPFME